MRILRVRQPVGKWWSRLSPLIPLVLIVAWYCHATHQLHAANPDDKMMPNGRQLWEAVLFAGAANKRVKRIVAITDYNKVQLASKTSEAVDLGDLAAKYRCFGWEALECDGHDMGELVGTLEQAKKAARQGPVAVIAHTVKGKGVSFMEGRYQWHGKAPNDEQYEQAIAEIG